MAIASAVMALAWLHEESYKQSKKKEEKFEEANEMKCKSVQAATEGICF